VAFFRPATRPRGKNQKNGQKREKKGVEKRLYFFCKIFKKPLASFGRIGYFMIVVKERWIPGWGFTLCI